MIIRIDHIGIAVSDLSRAIDIYKKMFNFEVRDIVESLDQKIRSAYIYSKEGETYIELMESTDPFGPVGKFISKKGEGLHHVSLQTNDIQKMSSYLKKNNLIFTTTEHIIFMGDKFYFTHPRGMMGVMFELRERTK